MRKIAYHSFTLGRRAIGYGLFGVIVTLVVVALYSLKQRPALEVWHTADLDEEFTEDSAVSDFAGYLKLEERLFDQLEKEVYQKTGSAEASSINRYQHGSMMDPTAMKPDWNRSFELKRENPQVGILLLHGLSDSPYSLRHLGEGLHAAGATVVGLRIPGHGTAPSGLVEVTWQDMAAAVRLAMAHVRSLVGDQPVFIVGYSNGGALAVNYALECLDDPALPKAKGLVLFSPEIGVSPAAGLAVWQGRIGHWLGMEQLAWTSVSLEYDPYKYGSFATNAGDLAHRITTTIDERLGKLSAAGRLGDFPPVIAFQSAVDATVSAPDLVSRLFNRLPPNGHELVIFDINRWAQVEHLLTRDPAGDLVRLLGNPKHPFILSIASNDTTPGKDHSKVVVRRREHGRDLERIDTGLSWPPEIYSLAHIALPFSGSDPLYGNGGPENKTTLGNIALHGEKGAIRVSAADMLRQRWNPFLPWVEKRVFGFCGVGAAGAGP
jgi:alpha-beta hydrolase superfamily lysophospholipase